MVSAMESRFERYTEMMVKALGHASREQPACWYLRGLMLPGERKSVEPMAARVHPQDVRSAHQRMHHLVNAACWVSPPVPMCNFINPWAAWNAAARVTGAARRSWNCW